METKEGRGRLEKQLAGLAYAWASVGNCLVSLPAPPCSTGTVLTWDFPPAPSTARVTESAQQMTWILKKEPKKLLQPRASISCGDRDGIESWGSGVQTKHALPCELHLGLGLQSGPAAVHAQLSGSQRQGSGSPRLHWQAAFLTSLP